MEEEEQQEGRVRRRGPFCVETLVAWEREKVEKRRRFHSANFHSFFAEKKFFRNFSQSLSFCKQTTKMGLFSSPAPAPGVPSATVLALPVTMATAAALGALLVNFELQYNQGQEVDKDLDRRWRHKDTRVEDPRARQPD